MLVPVSPADNAMSRLCSASEFPSFGTASGEAKTEKADKRKHERKCMIIRFVLPGMDQ